MKIKFIIISLIFIISCNKSDYDVYSKSEKPNWHKIDLKIFELEVPKDYKFKPHKGIDSFVGEVSNGKTTFSFDYGWYSNKNPVTPKEFFEKNVTRFYFNDLIDSIKTIISIDSLDNEIREKLIVKKVTSEENGKYVADMELNGEKIQFRFFPFDPDLESEYNKYEFYFEEDSNYYKKLYYPKSFESENKAGVYIEDLDAKRENKFGFNKLAFYTFDLSDINKQELIQILESVKMKKKPVQNNC